MARVTIRIQTQHDQELQADARQSRVSKNSLIVSVLRQKANEKLKPNASQPKRMP
jgi:predicted HicB family RNase H-like nuclease